MSTDTYSGLCVRLDVFFPEYQEYSTKNADSFLGLANSPDLACESYIADQIEQVSLLRLQLYCFPDILYVFVMLWDRIGIFVFAGGGP